jgi:Tfp pilus assembly protein PilV
MKQLSDCPLLSTIRRRLSDDRGFGITEALIAVTILVIGLLAVTGLTLATALQARTADLRSDQMITGQTAIEKVRQAGFAAAASGVDTVTTGGRTFYVTRTVTDINDRTKLVNVDIAAASGGPTMRDFSTVLQAPRPLPKG